MSVEKQEQAKKQIQDSKELRRLFNQLANNEPFALILGAGCSIGCKLPNFNELKKRILHALSGDLIVTKDALLPPVNLDSFDEEWESTGPGLRHSVLSNWFLPRPVSQEEYYPLALLLKGGYFSPVITYNMDSYLEMALHSMGFDDHLTLINGAHDIQFMQESIQRKDRLVILKTHGDHRHRVYALSQGEMIEFGDRCKPIVEPILSKKIIIVGYAAQDEDYIRAFPYGKHGDEIWFVNPAPPPPHLRSAMRKRFSSKNWINMTFESFMQTLYYGLLPTDSGGMLRERIRNPESNRKKISITVIVKNRFGIHARPAAMLVRLAGRYESYITLESNGVQVSISSIMGIVTLEAIYGSSLIATATGIDAQEAIDALKELFTNKFYED